MITFPKYESYKDSGEAWLGKVPSHWELLRAKRVFREISEKNHPEATLLSVTQDKGVIPRDELEQRVVMPIGQLQTFKLVRADDFVISLRSFQGGIEYSEHTGLVSPAYTVLRKDKNIDSGYLKWLLKSSGFISELNTSVTGIRQGKNIDFKDFCLSFLPIPKIDEQKRIAEFLDRKTAEIDEAIAHKQRLIELLQEQKVILINQAVTKGLNPNAPMRDSGIDWIGKIPDHWKIKRVKHVSTFITSGPRGWADYYADEGSFFLQSGNLNNSLGIDLERANRVQPPNDAEGRRTRLQNNDTLVCITGANTGRVAIASLKGEEVYINQHLCLIRPSINIAPLFLALCLRSVVGQTHFFLSQYGLKEGLGLDDVKNAFVLQPPLSEQNEIAQFITRIIKDFDHTEGKITDQIARINELKRVFISKTVTGKIKV